MPGGDITSDLAPGEALGQYRLICVLQRGGMGELFLAEDTADPGHRVVIKRLLPDFVDEDDYVAMFRDEARIMSRLDHPNIVRVLDTPVLRGSLSLVMELVPGRNVGQILLETRNQAIRMPPTVAVQIMIEVLRGLHYAHHAVDEDGQSLGLVHRDVSPGNLLVSFDGQVKVTDFGIAKSKLSVLATSVGVVKGTTRYLSPEQVRGAGVTPRSDLFACAAVLAEMLSGVTLFDRGQVPPTLLAIVKGQRPPISDLLPFDCPDLVAVIEQSLALSPTHRPESAGAMADALEAVRPQLGPLIDSGELGEYLARLFPQRSHPTEPGLEGPFGATYLMEVDGSEASPLKSSAVEGSMSGARPLDAREFESISPSQPISPPRGVAPARPRLRLEAKAVPPPVPSDDQKSVPTDPSGRQMNLVDAVEAAAREISAAGARPAESEPGISDSAAEADAFQLTREGVLPPRFHLRSFALGLAVGGGLVFLALSLLEPTPDPLPAEPVGRGVVSPASPAAPAAGRADPPPSAIVAEPVRLGSVGGSSVAGSTVAASSTEAEGAERSRLEDRATGYLTITRPRRARVRIDGVRLEDRVPLRRVEVPSGRVRIEISRRRFRREVEVHLSPGQHLDVSRDEIVVLEEGGGERSGAATPPADQ